MFCKVFPAMNTLSACLSFPPAFGSHYILPCQSPVFCSSFSVCLVISLCLSVFLFPLSLFVLDPSGIFYVLSLHSSFFLPLSLALPASSVCLSLSIA